MKQLEEIKQLDSILSTIIAEIYIQLSVGEGY